MPLNTIKNNKLPSTVKEKLNMPGVIGDASNLIMRDKRYLKLYDYLLDSTIIVDNIENALNFSSAIYYSAKVVIV